MLVGVGHRKQTGKDTCASILADYGYERFAFADPLRELARRVNPIVTFDHVGGVVTRWAEMEQRYGYEYAKAHCREFRDVLIRMGNEIRQVLGASTWVNATMAKATAVPFAVVSDVRYPNEAAAIKRAGGVLIKVVRPSVPDTDDVADCALEGWDGWDATIVNDGTLWHLRRQLTTLLNLPAEAPT